jgi:hypothetical protein
MGQFRRVRIAPTWTTALPHLTLEFDIFFKRLGEEGCRRYAKPVLLSALKSLERSSRQLGMRFPCAFLERSL